MAIDTEFLEDATKDLITLGVSLARHIHDRATTEPGTDLAEASKAFERVSRGTRRAILLARKLSQPPRAQRAAARKQIIRAVEDAIQRGDEDDETLQAELMDRLDSLDLEEDIESRPVEAIITDIIRDFGLAHMPGTHPWKRRTPADIAELHARATAPARHDDGPPHHLNVPTELQPGPRLVGGGAASALPPQPHATPPPR